MGFVIYGRIGKREKDLKKLSNNDGIVENKILENPIHTSIISENTYNKVKEIIAENNKKKERK